MLYINDPESPAKTYQEVMDAAIANGVEPKRVYIYLAAMGVRGGMARFLGRTNYSEPVKMAVMGTNTLVTRLEVCEHCGSLVINGNKKESRPVYKPATPVESTKVVDPAVGNWLIFSAGEYRSIEYAYSVSSLNEHMDIAEFTDVFKQYYKQNNSGRWSKI